MAAWIIPDASGKAGGADRPGGGVTGARRECSWPCELGWMVKKCHQEGAGGLGYCGGLQRLAVSVKLEVIIGRNKEVRGTDK